MSTVLYGFFGEDRGQRVFLAAYLEQCGIEALNISFKPVIYFGKKFGPTNNNVVDRLCADACREAYVIGYPKLHWLFIGRDVDSYESARYEKLRSRLQASIPEKWQNRVLLMLPVQCIEHWLLYLAQYPERTALERRPNDQTKDAVYADTAHGKDKIVSDLLATLTPERISWLAEVSPSFRAFHTQVQAYLDTLEAA